MTVEGETKVTVESMSLMGRGVSEVCATTPWEGWYGEENGARERDEDELKNELDSGKMSMYTGVRVSGRWFRLDDGMLWCRPEDVDEPVDELSLLDVEELEYEEEGERLDSSWLWGENLRRESTSLPVGAAKRESINSLPSNVSLNCCRRLPICFDDLYFPVLR